MRNIRITNPNNEDESVKLLDDIEFKIIPEEENISSKMASKRIVKDVIGYRDTLEIPVGYLSVEDMAKLRTMIRKTNGFLNLEYDTPDGDRSELFVIDDIPLTAVKYNDNGVAVWLNVTITGRSAEVIDAW